MVADHLNELHEKMKEYQENRTESGATSSRMEEIRVYLHGVPEENLTYDDNLIRQVVQTVKVVDEEAICVVLKDGSEIPPENREKGVEVEGGVRKEESQGLRLGPKINYKDLIFLHKSTQKDQDMVFWGQLPRKVAIIWFHTNSLPQLDLTQKL